MIHSPIKKLALLAGICTVIISALTAQDKRDYLQTEYLQHPNAFSPEKVTQYRVDKKAEMFEIINQLPESIKKDWIAEGEKALNYQWPSLPAMQFMEYKLIGNRMNYEGAANKRHYTLCNLVAAELVENKGRFMNDIVNGLWLVLEESSWSNPAHITLQKSGVGLPDPYQDIIDLMVGERAADVSWIYLMMKEKLDGISPMICKRIEFEINRRIVVPFLRDNYWWMGFNRGTVNNWNIWVNTNVLATTLLVVDDADTRSKIFDKVFKSADNFVNSYPEDGGCDEGAAYWGEAGGKLIQFISTAREASKNELDWSKVELIHKIGSYIEKVHIEDDRVVNFADAFAKAIPDPPRVFAYGQTFSDSALMKFGSWLYQRENKDGEKISSNRINICFDILKYRKALLSTLAKAPYLAESWLSNLQVLTLRSNAGSSKGLFLAAQGGHNDESHNHNDVGNFILYVDGNPAIIDAGVGTYTAKTFSSQRYTLWNMQSQWHNCPTINGVMQKNGRQYAASEVKYISTPSVKTLSMDIAKAYPEEALVNTYTRKFQFYPAKNELALTDNYELKECKEPMQLNFMTCLNMQVIKEGELSLNDSDNKPVLRILYNSKQLTPESEVKQLDDERLSRIWGTSINRIIFKSKQSKTKDNYSIRFIKP